MKIFTYQFDYEIPEELIGVYIKESGDSPHDLMAFNNPLEWSPPTVEFDSELERIDAIPATNLPLHVASKELAEAIKEVARDDIVLIPFSVKTKDNISTDFYVLHPVKRVSIWDMEASKWEPLDIPDWPKDRPMYMHDMVLMQKDIEPFSIAYNKNWNSMLVFNQEIAGLLSMHSNWLKIITPEHYSNA